MADQASQGLLSPFLQRRRLRAARQFLNGRILDIGCGNGSLCEYCDPDRYFGFDIDKETVAVARAANPGFRFEQSLPDAGEQFDTVVGLAIIEHLRDPSSHLRSWKSYLTSGGAIVLTTPHPSLGWAHTLGASMGLFSRDASDEHEDLLGKRELIQLGRESDLDLVDYQRFLYGANQLVVYKELSTDRSG